MCTYSYVLIIAKIEAHSYVHLLSLYYVYMFHNAVNYISINEYAIVFAHLTCGFYIYLKLQVAR